MEGQKPQQYSTRSSLQDNINLIYVSVVEEYKSFISRRSEQVGLSKTTT